MFTDGSGGVYPVDLVGIDIGPRVVTAVDLGDGPVVRCPACFGVSAVQSSWLGHAVTCPLPGCAARQSVNRSFAVARPIA
jgi:hypothetical protein